MGVAVAVISDGERGGELVVARLEARLEFGAEPRVAAAVADDTGLNAESGASWWYLIEASMASRARPGDTGFRRNR